MPIRILPTAFQKANVRPRWFAVSPSGTHLFVPGSIDSMTTYIEIDTWKTYDIRHIAFSCCPVFANDSKLYGSSNQGHLFELTVTNAASLITNQTAPVTVVSHIQISPDRNSLITCAPFDFSVNVWNAHNLSQQRNLPGHENTVIYKSAFNSDNSRIATCANISGVIIWSLESGRPIKYLYHDTPVDYIQFISAHLLIAHSHNKATLWDIHTGQIMREWQVSNIMITLTPDNLYLCTLENGTPTFWDVNTGRLIEMHYTPAVQPNITTIEFAYTAEKKYMVLGYRDHMEIREVQYDY